MLDDAIKLKQKIISNSFSFDEMAFSVFHFQYKYNHIYRQFIDLSKININEINHVHDIPFLPIQLFKSHKIYIAPTEPNLYFESSGTTQTIQSKHFIYDIDLYIESFVNGFTQFFGAPSDYNIIALLPNYLERQHSSLVFMVEYLMQQSNSEFSGFFLHDFDPLNQLLQKSKQNNRKTILFGVTYALLDFAAAFPQNLSDCIIIETGGMKGKRKEMTKEEVHATLKQSFNINAIGAEYGMTELLSQAYSLKDGNYICSNTMRVFCRDIYNPKEIIGSNKRGVINVIDLCNLYSCSFISTQDIGIVHDDESFEILGRLDNSDVRGCNLMFS